MTDQNKNFINIDLRSAYAKGAEFMFPFLDISVDTFYTSFIKKKRIEILKHAIFQGLYFVICIHDVKLVFLHVFHFIRILLQNNLS
jgi:hypothetical protein